MNEPPREDAPDPPATEWWVDSKNERRVPIEEWVPDPDPHDSARWMGKRAVPTYDENHPPPDK